MIRQIGPDDASALVSGETCFVDIRDQLSFASARIPGARHLTMQTLDTFLAEVSTSTPLVVYCFHGHSSLDATAFLLEKGYQDVCSLQGGFEVWRQRHPEQVDASPL